MASLAVRSPLARFAGAEGCAVWHTATVSIREQPAQGLVRMQLLNDDAAIRAALVAQMRVDLPLPGQMTGTADLRCAWITPAEWLWLTADDRAAGIAVSLDSVCAANAAITLISASRVCLQLQGSAARAVLAKGCGLDFHRAVFQPGGCTTTRFAQIPVMIARPDDAPAFNLYGDRSQAAYLWCWLVDAAAEFAAA